MSNSPLGTSPIIKGLKGLAMTQQHVAELIHRKPVLEFSLRTQIVQNSVGEAVFGVEASQLLEEGRATAEWADIVFHVQIDPSKIRPAHNNRIQAIQMRVATAQRMMERMAPVEAGQARPRAAAITWNDLPDADILIQLYKELDDAMDDRLLDCVMTRDGQTLWDYFGETGNHVNLTKELLQFDVRMAEAIQKSFEEWHRPTKALSPEVTPTTKEDGTKGQTSPTPNPS